MKRTVSAVPRISIVSMDAQKHIKYFKRNLDSLPNAYTCYDSSHVSLVFFCLAGLKLLNGLDDIPSQDRLNWIEWIYKHLVGSQNCKGFRGSLSHQLDENIGDSLYDPPNLSCTYFCLASLCILQDRSLPTRIDRRAFLQYLKLCQRPDGGFNGVYHSSTGPFGDGDARYIYVASAVRRILGCDDSCQSFDVEKAYLFIKSTLSYDGGMSDYPGSESHSGLTYCGLAALALCDHLDPTEWGHTAKWLSNRQLTQPLIDTGYWDVDDLGGVNGRCNKPADTCYSFWTGASLKLLGFYDFIDTEAQKHFLLEYMQSALLGGFAKSKDSYPDPLHSFLGLAALALDGDSFDAALCLPKSTVQFIDSLQWPA